MIEGLNTEAKRRWPKLALGAAALVALSGATGWGAAHLAAKSIGAPDLTKVKAALKLRLPKTPIDAINCEGLGGLCEVASKTTLFYVDTRAKYLVIGRIYDMEARQDLTAARLLALNPDLLAAGAARRGGGGPVRRSLRRRGARRRRSGRVRNRRPTRWCRGGRRSPAAVS